MLFPGPAGYESVTPNFLCQKNSIDALVDNNLEPNYGDYKFSRGGVEQGESHRHALARKLRQECGVLLLSMDGKLSVLIE